MELPVRARTEFAGAMIFVALHTDRTILAASVADILREVTFVFTDG